MEYTIQLEQAPPRLLAAVSDRANLSNLGQKIVERLSPVWEWVRTSRVSHTGHNVVVYLDDPESSLLKTDEGVPLVIGVEITTHCEGGGQVICTSTPLGTVATAMHVGPYSDLHMAHAAVRDWCREHGHALAGTNWEVYGHWTDNPAELETQVFYLLK